MSNPDRRTFARTALGIAAAATAPAFASATLDSESRPLAQEEPDPQFPGRTRNTRFAINIEMWNFGTGDHVKRIRAAAALGFDAVEMWGLGGKDLTAIRKTLDETGVELAQFTGWGEWNPARALNNRINHDRFVEGIEASCKVAGDLDCRMMTVIAGQDVPGHSQEQMHQALIDGLRKAAPVAEAHEVMMILEPMNIRVDHKGHCLYGSPDAVRICREVDSPMVKINWDLYHMQITEGDLCRRLREGWDQVGYIQLADNPGRMEPGTGEINYRRVFQEIKKLGYGTTPVGVECRPSASPHESALRLAQADVF